jgi:hypothetical protein
MCRCEMSWGTACLSVVLGTDEVGVLLSVGIFPKLLVYCFINGVIVINAKLVHMYILFAGKEYVVLFRLFRNFPFFSFPHYCQCLIYASICVSCI